MEGDSSDPTVSYEANYEIIGAERDEMIGEVNPAIFTTVDRSNKESKKESGTVFGKNGVKFQLKTGRYRISGYPVGNVFIYDSNNKLVLREIVGDVAGVNSLTVDIDESYSIVMDGGYGSVDAKPVGTELSTVLTAGIWDVGLDIEPGEYSISIPYGYGYVQIHEQGKDPLLYELIGGEIIKSENKVSLKKGQKVRVTKTSIVTFEPNMTGK
ncbi:hypothetical protein QTL97_07680 [Sporosarcina thermotolerans]|uniref:Uncharacterized protein n=1 Tax=Sporosarcina thermotolerans TaxID=633404 RepID=A0AAW9ACI6_9BACL|nr:hypothetical protein [Sporosarcina thermotolerans]MDW0116808.1 hypothetical protein [Sporosarcina thermotolerans]WHT48981.1 hypothetical protein QNH10_04630 [Sporosarcina thermotolerans]